MLQATIAVADQSFPSLSLLSPASATAGGPGFTLSVVGNDFTPSSVVLWNGSPRSTTYVSAGQLMADIPASDVASATTVFVSVTTPGIGTSASLAFSIVPPAGLAAFSLFPSSVQRGSGAFTLQVSGSGFAPGAAVHWNGSPRATTFSSSSFVMAQIAADDVASAGTAQVTVVNPDSTASNALTFTISTPPPLAVSSISPQSAFAGTAGFTLTLFGTSFTPSSVVRWNGSARPTTFNGSSFLSAQIAAADIAIGGTAEVTVADGAAVSSALSFQILTQPGVTLVNLAANDVAWDPWQRKLYLSIPSGAPANGNTVAVFDPFAATVTRAEFAGSEPHALALSDDGRFLYVGLDGASAVKRFALPELTPDGSGTISLGQDSFFGPYFAKDVQVAPGAPHTVAVSLGNAGVSPSAEGGVVIYDDATPRAKRAPGFGGTGNLFDTLQWGADAGTLFAANNESTGFDFYRLSVAADGVSIALDAAGAASGFGARIHFDRTTGLVYSDGGRVVDGDGVLQGTFGASGAMAPDAALNRAYFFTPFPPSGTANFRTFDLTRFTPADSLTIQGLPFPTSAGRVVRFGADGVAILAVGQLVLVRGTVVLPVSATANATPSIAALSPSSAPAGSANLRVTITGTGFVPGSAVLWNAAERSATFVSPTQIVAYVPASDLASNGNVDVTVVNPTPGGGTSLAATFAVGP